MTHTHPWLCRMLLAIILSTSLFVSLAPAAEAPATTNATAEHPDNRRGAGRGFGGPIILNADDKQIFSNAPTGFDVKRDGIAHGELAMIEYASKTVGTQRKMQVYLPPGYSAAKEKLKLLWLSCGNQDGLIRISQGVHAYLKTNNVPQLWNVDGNAHDTPEWKNNFYWFAQQIFH